MISPYYFYLAVHIVSPTDIGYRYHISRERQDEFAARSQNKAEAAQKQGKFVDEIIPVIVNGQTVSQDDGIRAGATAASLAKLKPVFKSDGTTHAGNASQLTDGAAAVILARRSVAKSLGLPILGKVVSVTTIGVPPRVRHLSNCAYTYS